jgi:hypothetical protein
MKQKKDNDKNVYLGAGARAKIEKRVREMKSESFEIKNYNC